MDESADLGAVDTTHEGWHPRRLLVVLSIVVVLVALGLVSGLVPLPGGLRRYSDSELEAVAEKIGTGCMQSPSAKATVDHARSRVIANGGISWNTELTAYERGMVENPKLISCTKPIE